MCSSVCGRSGTKSFALARSSHLPPPTSHLRRCFVLEESPEGGHGSCHSDDMAAAGFPTLDQMTGARVPGHLSDHQPTAVSGTVDTIGKAPATYHFATPQNPQRESDLTQFNGSPLPRLDAFKAQDSISTVHIKHSGGLSEGYERGQSTPGVELRFAVLEDTAGRHEHQRDSGADASLGNDRQPELLTYPPGEVDAVTLTESDLEGLEPEGFLSNNVVDFYIRYLERTLCSEERTRFHFFSSFFFTKLLGQGSASTVADRCEVDYEQVRKWTGGVNLFEKDYVFVPILRRSHWSLVVICHFPSLTSAPDDRRGSPCVLHLDSVEGEHESFEAQVRSYMIQAWMERCRDPEDRDRVILALMFQMKYVRTEVPQQGNGYDCGVYVLHYVEVFIRESAAAELRLGSSRRGPQFTDPDFAAEVDAKRTFIRGLIRELSKHPPERAGRRIDTRPKPQPGASDARGANPRPGRSREPPKEQSKASKKWSKEQTSVLLNRMVEGGRVRKGSGGATHWSLISQEIGTRLGAVRSEDECRRRYDTLLKAYKKMKGTGKAYGDVTAEERAELNLATPLIEEWYEAMGTICDRHGAEKAEPRKRAKLHASDKKGVPSASPPIPRLPATTAGVVGSFRALGKASREQAVIPGFGDLREQLRFTLVNLVRPDIIRRRWWKLEKLCRRVAVVQDGRAWQIRGWIFELLELNLVSICFDDKERLCVDLSKTWVYEKFVDEMRRKYSHLDIFLELGDDSDSVTFPRAPVSLSLQRIKVLRLHRCKGLEHVDLSYFPELRFVDIRSCDRLTAVTGWKVVKELRWLEIRSCCSYVDFPRVECLASLREFRLLCSGRWMLLPMVPVPDFSQCVRLRILKIFGIEFLTLNGVDLSTLRFLEVLMFAGCDDLMTIRGLSGLHSLTTLDLKWCKALRRVPELGCLKTLTHLDMSGSGVEEISGVQELHVLTDLCLDYCGSLKMLPWLGHLKVLARVGIRRSGVEEIPGVQDLVGLETLDCRGSRLKRLPGLRHLPRLRRARVGWTPLSTTDISSLFFASGDINYNWDDEDFCPYDDDLYDSEDEEYENLDYCEYENLDYCENDNVDGDENY